MSQVMVNFRQDADIKAQMEAICKELGFNPSVAYNIFARKVVREKRIPFDLSVDPFFSSGNIKRLQESEEQFRNGKVVVKTMDELEAMENE